MFCIFTPICGVEVHDNTRASLDELTKLNNKIIRIRQTKERNDNLSPPQLFNYWILNLAHETIG